MLRFTFIGWVVLILCFRRMSAVATANFPAVQEQSYVPPPIQHHSQPPPQQQVFSQSGGASVADEPLSKRFNFFDLELLHHVALSSSPTENVFVSPASIKATLAMLTEGAKENTAMEIYKALRLPMQPQYVRDQLRTILYDISDGNLISANGVFASNKLRINPAYQRAIQEFYHSGVQSVNMENSAQTASTINSWVSSASRGLIQEIISPGAIDRETKIVVANVMYFKAIWRYAFDPTLTTTRCFTLPTGECGYAYMMQNSRELNYKFVAEIDAHALEIPYTDDFAMLIIVPQVRNNINALMKDIQHMTFNGIVDQLEHQEVFYEIPRFEIESTTPLVQNLKNLGIKEIFTDNANLSGIVSNERVHVDDILHKTKIQVNEEGTVAAAATAAIVIPLMGSAAPRVVANHPFLFFIYKRSNRNIVFEGIVNQPTLAPPTQAAPLRSTYPVTRNNLRPGVVSQQPYHSF